MEHPEKVLQWIRSFTGTGAYVPPLLSEKLTALPLGNNTWAILEKESDYDERQYSAKFLVKRRKGKFVLSFVSDEKFAKESAGFADIEVSAYGAKELKEDYLKPLMNSDKTLYKALEDLRYIKRAWIEDPGEKEENFFLLNFYDILNDLNREAQEEIFNPAIRPEQTTFYRRPLNDPSEIFAPFPVLLGVFREKDASRVSTKDALEKTLGNRLNYSIVRETMFEASAVNILYSRMNTIRLLRREYVSLGDMINQSLVDAIAPYYKTPSRRVKLCFVNKAGEETSVTAKLAGDLSGYLPILFFRTDTSIPNHEGFLIPTTEIVGDDPFIYEGYDRNYPYLYGVFPSRLVSIRTTKRFLIWEPKK